MLGADSILKRAPHCPHGHALWLHALDVSIASSLNGKCWSAGAGLAAVAVLAAVVLSPRAAFAESEVKMYVGQAAFCVAWRVQKW